ncbi:MAG: hypothetical protein HGA87_04460 [Desulfobulbaceae bacterium]|nr:hypothetical protein [Desulfobulbaceae bacterium]
MTQTTRYHRSFRLLRAVLFATVLELVLSSCAYMKMSPPADADKTFLNNNNSCYLATASNMLAGAGYGNGTTVQARADNIYQQLIAQFGTASGGWADAAVSWWLSSPNNVWTTNPYTVVTVYGNKSPKYPWADANGAQFIGNELRTCHFVGLSISWPDNSPGVIGSGGHAITAWGDNLGNSSSISSNPTQVRVTDSDTDNGGDVQVYTYDAYTNPNPGGANEGNGWYFNYDNNHPYIKHIATLSPTTSSTGTENIQRVIGSYKVHQDQEKPATDLHYKVGTDVNILSYRTNIDWGTDLTPTITENQPRRELTVDWNLSSKPVPYCNWITITTEFILRNWNSIQYSDVHFTYPDGKANVAPNLNWLVKTPKVEGAAKIPNVTGGYLIGRFDIMKAGPNGYIKVGEYRFLHQYSYDQSPENHAFIINGERDFVMTNLAFGHSYGYLEEKTLWNFQEWMTREPDKMYKLGEEPVEIKIDWTGKLPYPKGEDIRGRIPEKQKPTDPKR